MQSASKEESGRPLVVVVLAAGLGTRMKSKIPKVLQRICGRPMITWVSQAVSSIDPDRTLVVLGRGVEEVADHLDPGVEVVMQEQQLGTGDAVRACAEALEGFSGDILVMYSDTPLVTGGELAALHESHRQSGSACTLMSVELDDPAHYGRICRGNDGRVNRIVEHRDAGVADSGINEVNAGVYVFRAEELWPALAKVGDDNAQGEIYLTDVIEILASGGGTVRAFSVDDPAVVMGVNSKLDLAEASSLVRRRILDAHMVAGVTVVDPSSTYVDAGVTIGPDTVLEPMTVLAGETVIGAECAVGPSSTVIDTVIGDNVRLVSSYVEGARIASGCLVGPFAYLRPGARLEEGAKAGTFVEIKNSSVGPGSKVPHLSYIGDAEIGSGTNIGAGNITANYDGVNKHKTIIGSGVHTGADTVFVAPVSAGDGSMTGAGSVITGDVAPGDLGIARARQKNIAGYALRKKGSAGKEEGEK